MKNVGDKDKNYETLFDMIPTRDNTNPNAKGFRCTARTQIHGHKFLQLWAYPYQMDRVFFGSLSIVILCLAGCEIRCLCLLGVLVYQLGPTDYSGSTEGHQTRRICDEPILLYRNNNRGGP